MNAVVDFKIVLLSLVKITWLPFAALLLYNSLLSLFVYSHLLRARSFSLLAEIRIPIHTAMLLSSVSHNENLTASIRSISWRSSCILHTLSPLLFVRRGNSSKGTPLSFYIHSSPRLVLHLFEAVSSCVLLAWIHLCLFKLLQSFRYPVFSSQRLLFLISIPWFQLSLPPFSCPPHKLAPPLQKQVTKVCMLMNKTKILNNAVSWT